MATSRRLRWVLTAGALVALALAAGGWLAFGATGKRSTTETARATGRVTCAQALLADWADGRIDHIYPIACYRAALKSLPADLEAYSSAADDIAGALRERIVLGSEAHRTLSR
jgi:hypothetical protein